VKILVVEDDEAIANVLSLLLSSHNYVVEVAVDGQIAWELIEVYDYDLILLDVLLPKLDGISLCQRLRSHGYQMPILLLTGQDNSQDKAMGLDAGADDYIVKPRIRALLRRASVNPAPVLEWGSLQLNPATGEVTYAENLLSLTPKEYALLELFLRNTRRVFSYGAIQDHLWAYEDIPSEDAVRTHIKTLRQKLKKAGAPADSIETVYGIGYRLKPLESKAKNRQLESFNLPSTAKGEPIEQQTLTALSEVWNRFKARVNKQIEILQQAATALMNQALDRELRQQAEQKAHTLSGSLGTFGFPKGSQLAKRIERMLQVGESLKQNEIVCLCELVAALHQEVKQSPEELNLEADEEPIDGSDPRPLLLVVDRDRP
jgi:DNA-binding response OmpR family regulator/HPt (histidine-containing phosphotransfer) domain-containing protein